MKLKEIKKMLNKKISSKKLKKIILNITPSEFKKEIKNKGTIVDIIKRKIKSS